MSSPHASDDDLVDLAEGRLATGRRDELLVHADDCVECRRVLAGVGRAVLTPSPIDDEEEETALVRGTAVGRYLITDLLGSGGMGEVHAAYDPELDRRVALKLLHPGRADERPRLLREAQAMARLSHPNVVPVHDVGVWGDRFFIAMELIEGQTLRAWLSAESRSWRRVLAVFDQAGRGLAAAHAVGIVHRDFKPDNVLLGVDGRVRVADFGVARTAQGEDDERPAGLPEPDLTVTRTGMMLGTPAYMAPELLGGARAATPASDQFSFCVALHEALYGERPATPPEARAPRGRRVPAWVRRIVLRGMAPGPDDRWPSMEALLEALGKDPARHVRRGAMLAVVLAGAAFAIVARPTPPPPVRRCAAGASLVGVWDEAARGQARAAFTASLEPGATRMFESFAAAIDEWVDRWQRTRTRSCEETLVEGIQSEEIMDGRAACLDRQLADLRAVAQVAAQPSPRLVESALQLAGGLPDAARCDRRAVLDARRIAPPPDPAARQLADELGAELAHADALSRAGRYEDALALAERLASRARALAYPPVEARALESHAGALQGLRRPQEAGPLLERAYRMASAVGDDPLALRSLAQLVFVVGVMESKYDEGLVLARDAELLAARTADHENEPMLDYARGILHFEKQDPDGARAYFERSRAAMIKAYGADDFRISNPLGGLGMVAMRLEDLGAALRYHQEGLALAERVLGPDDRRTVARRSNLASVMLHEMRDYAGARAELLRALPPPWRAPTGGDGFTVANLALARAHLGDYAGVVEEMERGLALVAHGFGEVHHATASVRVGLAELLVDVEREPEALAQLRQALAIWRKLELDNYEVNLAALTMAHVAAGAGEPVDLGAARAALAGLRREVRPGGGREALGAALLCHTLVRLRRFDVAPADCAAAHQAALTGLPADHPDRAFALWGVAQATGRTDVALIEQALAILERRQGDVILQAAVRSSLAHALAERGDRERARAEGARARAALVAALGPASRRAAALDRWLRSL